MNNNRLPRVDLNNSRRTSFKPVERFAGMNNLIDIAGKRYGRLIVIRRAPNDKFGSARWLCRCDCGQETTVRGGNLRRGTSQSCGCLRDDVIATHGLSKSNSYDIWRLMKRRCSDPDNKSYPDYGGRGIGYDPRWEIFENFYFDMGECPKGFTIDRVDNNGGYCKENCRWASRKDQNRNSRKNTLFTYLGKTQCASAWAEEFGINYDVLRQRLMKLRWPMKRAVTEPVQYHQGK
jgi:hypothetical protein